MANPEHVKILKQGVGVWNRWRAENRDEIPDFCKADFTGVNLSGAKLKLTDLSMARLSGADLSRSDFTGADLRWSDLTRANLTEAILAEAKLNLTRLNVANLSRTNLTSANLTEGKLIDANLNGANFSSANLTSANLTDANLNEANLTGVNLTGANLSRAKLIKVIIFGAKLSYSIINETTISNVDLSKVRGLDSIKHWGPSYIDVSTLYTPEGKIPDTFLRGCGIPDNLIEYLSSLTNKAFEYYSCFISYSSKEQDFAERLYADLQNKGVRCWFAPEDLKIGDKIRDRIDQSIRIHDKLLLILSEHSINSDWVEDEVEAAYEQERQRAKTILFPIRLDSAVMDTDKSWAAKLRRSRHIGEFTQWKDHVAYQKAFDRLMRDLKAEEPTSND